MNTEITFWIGQQAHPLLQVTTTVKGLLIIASAVLLASTFYDFITKKHE